MVSSSAEWIKTLIIALATSFFTVCFIEPVRSAVQRLVKRREIRRSLYHEIVLNFRALDGQVAMAKHDPEMKQGIGSRFGRSFKKSSFEIAQHDPITYYGLRDSERYWIELLYADMEHVVNGDFDNDEQRLRAAWFTAESLLSCIRNRQLSRRLILRVSPVQMRRRIRERLPDAKYVDIDPPALLERLRRKLDRYPVRNA